MKTSFKKIPLAFVVVFIAATANAACGDFDKPATPCISSRGISALSIQARYSPFQNVIRIPSWACGM